MSGLVEEIDLAGIEAVGGPDDPELLLGERRQQFRLGGGAQAPHGNAHAVHAFRHPCGSDTWVVIRTGADIKIKCQGCGRIVMLDREVFLKRRKKLLAQGPAAE